MLTHCLFCPQHQAYKLLSVYVSVSFLCTFSESDNKKYSPFVSVLQKLRTSHLLVFFFIDIS